MYNHMEDKAHLENPTKLLSLQRPTRLRTSIKRTAMPEAYDNSHPIKRTEMYMEWERFWQNLIAVKHVTNRKFHMVSND